MWKDTTSYSRGGDRIPHCWSIQAGELYITVLDSHLYYPGKWVMHCNQLQIDTQYLGVKTLEEAKAKAVETVKKLINKWKDALEKI